MSDNEQNLIATAKKVERTSKYALLPEWDAIEKQEGILMDGLSERANGHEVVNVSELVPV